MSKQHNSIKSKIKLELIKHFDDIQFDIDTHAQQILVPTEAGQKKKRKIVLNQNEKMISLAKDAFESNMNKINEYEFENNSQIEDEEKFKEYLKKHLFTKYCFYAKHELKRSKKTHNSYGFMLVTDWYLDTNQLAYLRWEIQRETCPKIVTFFNIDSDIINLHFKIFNKNTVDLNGKVLRLEKQKIADEVQQLKKFHLAFDFNNHFELKNYELKYESFIRFEHLETLRINVNELTRVDDFALRTLSSLKELYLSSMKLEHFSPNVFTGLINLKNLTINANFSYKNVGPPVCLFEGSVFDDKMFEDLKSLNELKFTVKNLPSLSKNLFKGLSNLQKLDINTCCLETIDHEAFKMLKNLKTLIIWIPGHIITNQQWLNICSNKSLVLKSGSFSHQQQLENLTIDIESLEFIEDEAFMGLTNLNLLKIRSRTLKKITKNTFKGLKSLEKLIVNENANIFLLDLSVEEGSFEDLVNLKYLRLYINKLPTVGEKFFHNLFNLETLNINASTIGDIHMNAFKYLHQLRVLSFNTADKSLSNLTRTLASREKIMEHFGLSDNHKINLWVMDDALHYMQIKS